MKKVVDYSSYRYTEMNDSHFPIQVIIREKFAAGPVTNTHWHEHIQVYVITDGRGVLLCNSKKIDITKNDVLIINSNELHSLESFGDLSFCIITIDYSFLYSYQVDICQTKYIAPISQNLIIFNNLIRNDNKVYEAIIDLIREYEETKIGYELVIKANFYHILVHLLRNHIDHVFDKKEYDSRVATLKRYQKVFEYINNNFHEDITIDQLAQIASVSNSHLCRLFKQITGKTMGDYVNVQRIEKAATLLKESELNISEVAFAVGYNDANYFSRLFKQLKRITPTQYKNINTVL